MQPHRRDGAQRFRDGSAQFHQAWRRHWPREGRPKRDDAEVCIFPLCSSPGAETARNAFVTRRRYGKVTSRIPGWTRWPSAQLAISLCGTRRGLREAAVVSSADALPRAVFHSHAACRIQLLWRGTLRSRGRPVILQARRTTCRLPAASLAALRRDVSVVLVTGDPTADPQLLSQALRKLAGSRHRVIGICLRAGTHRRGGFPRRLCRGDVGRRGRDSNNIGHPRDGCPTLRLR